MHSNACRCLWSAPDVWPTHCGEAANQAKRAARNSSKLFHSEIVEIHTHHRLLANREQPALEIINYINIRTMPIESPTAKRAISHPGELAYRLMQLTVFQSPLSARLPTCWSPPL
ncbi:hypothetical protein ABW21_db0200303 [Orbilia brochopaga]|nr:hypothetical protein ABW21_db0200303 [Drechslerella brochopaga]